jgi:hypothetical protein
LIETCAKLNAVYIELDVMHFVIADDFNSQSGSRFYNVTGDPENLGIGFGTAVISVSVVE